MLIEYDLRETCFDNGVVILGTRTRIEQSAIPQALAWHPDNEAENFLLMVGDKCDPKSLIW
jgi:hypothetical protein